MSLGFVARRPPMVPERVHLWPWLRLLRTIGAGWRWSRFSGWRWRSSGAGHLGNHPGHYRFALRAWLPRWDNVGAPRHWHESAGDGYPLPRDIGRHQPLGCPPDQPPAALQEILPLVAMGAVNDPLGPLCVPHWPAEGEREVGGKGEDSGAPVVAVHGADGAPTFRQTANGGLATPWHAAVMFVVWNPDRGVCLLVWQRPHWCVPGGARWWCRWVLLPEDVQPLNFGPVHSFTRPDILGNQGAQCVERGVVCLGFGRRQSCAEGLRPSTKLAGIQVRDARAAEPVQLLGAAAAEVMPKERALLSSTISQQTLHVFPGPRGCGASPAGILRRGTGRETIRLLYGGVRAVVQCGVVGGAAAVSRGLPCVSVCG